MEAPAKLPPPPDAVVTLAHLRNAPARPGTLLGGPAEGREWALVRVRDPGTALDGRVAWADVPAGSPAALRIAARTIEGVFLPGLGLGRLLTAREADEAERAFAWGVLLASDAAIADIAAEEAWALLQGEAARAALRLVPDLPS